MRNTTKARPLDTVLSRSTARIAISSQRVVPDSGHASPWLLRPCVIFVVSRFFWHARHARPSAPLAAHVPACMPAVIMTKDAFSTAWRRQRYPHTSMKSARHKRNAPQREGARERVLRAAVDNPLFPFQFRISDPEMGSTLDAARRTAGPFGISGSSRSPPPPTSTLYVSSAPAVSLAATTALEHALEVCEYLFT